MPKSWLYIFALILPLLIRLLTLSETVIDWFWYHQYTHLYTLLSALSVQPQFQQFVGGWPFPVFIITVFSYWIVGDEEEITHQFLMLPIAYVPFTIFGDWLLSREIHESALYIHPLVIIPAGYAYVLTWVLFVRMLDKMRLIM